MPPESNYPAPPWSVHGQGLMVFSYPSIKNHEFDWPSELTAQSLLFNRTLAGYYIAEYDSPLMPDGTALWHEWGNIMGYASVPRGNGLWISSMAVDCENALTGGKELWGLNKFPGEFQWTAKDNRGKAALILPEGRIELTWKERGPSFGLSPSMNFFTWKEGLIQRYSVRIRAAYRLSRVEIIRRDIPAFDALSLRKYWAVRFQDADIRVSAPSMLPG